MKKMSMGKHEFIQEHKKLIKILTSGSKIDQMNEAKKQGDELKKVLATKSKESLAIKGLV